MFATGSAWRICILFGTPVYLTSSYLLLVVLGFMFTGWDLERGFLWIFAVTASLFIHEFGHVFAARANGHSSEVYLWGLGGVTVPSGESRGWRGIFMSLAGPGAGFLAAYLLYLFAMPGDLRPDLLDYARGGSRYPIADTTLWPYLHQKLVFIGMVWTFFNLLPIYPMDGGHALEDFLGLFMRRHQAAKLSALAGMLVGIPVAVLGLMNGFLIVGILVGWMALQNYERFRGNS